MSIATERSRELLATVDAVRQRFAGNALVATPSAALWEAAQTLLQAYLQRPVLTGQALIAEARNARVLTLADAHVLVGLATWAGQSGLAARTEDERRLVHEARLVVEHVAEQYTNELTGMSAAASRGTSSASVVEPVVAPEAPRAPSSRRSWGDRFRPHRRRALTAGGALLMIAVVIVAILTTWQARQRERELNRNLAAASRDLGIVLIGNGQMDAARRILVRSLTVTPDDVVAQGYLACALWRMQRVEEARRWAQRAGRGPWERCWNAPAAYIPAPTGGSPAPYPSSMP